MHRLKDMAEIISTRPVIFSTDLKFMVLIPPLLCHAGGYFSGSGDSGATRTLDPQLRRLLLYPTELRNRTGF